MKKILIGILLLFVTVVLADVPPVTGVGISSSYKQLMFVKNATGSTNVGLGATLQELMDGAGQSSGLYISKAANETNNIALQFNTGYKLSFRDAALLVFSSVDGQLDIDADGEVEIATATVDINVSSGLNIDGALTDIGGGTYGTADGDDDLGVAGDLEVDTNCDFDGNLDVDGTTYLDAVETEGSFRTQATTFNIDATDDIDLDTSDTTGGINLGGNSSGTPITIGHTTSETTVGDNLTVTGTSTLTGAVTLSSTLATGGKLTAGGNEVEGSSFDINGGNIDGTAIGSSSTSSGAFTTITNSGTITSSDDILLGGNELILESTGNDTSIDANTNDIIDFGVNGTDELHLSADRLYPETNGGLDVGKDTTNEFQSIYLSEDVDCGDDLIVGDDGTISGKLDVSESITADGTSMIVAFNYASSDTGSDTYTATPSPAVTSYVAGQIIILNVVTNNTGACTLNLNGLGAKDIKIMHTGALANPANDDIDSDGIYILIYDGTQFQLTNPS